MRTFKHCRLRTGRILCNTCICLPASIQTPKGKKDALKAGHHNQNTTILQTECQKDRFHPKQVARWLLKKKNQQHTCKDIQ